jgi:hypothetical protein
MTSTIIYLENFVESTTFLPVELQRILNTIKSLDERSMELLENIKRNVEALTNIPTVAGRSTPEEVIITRGLFHPHDGQAARAPRSRLVWQHMLIWALILPHSFTGRAWPQWPLHQHSLLFQH